MNLDQTNPADSRQDRLIIFFIFLITFLTRLPFIKTLSMDPAFYMPVFDCKEFVYWAFQILNINHWTWVELNNHTPLYAYFLAVIFKTLGHNLLIVTLIQHLIFSFNTVLIYVITKRLVNRLTGLIAAGFMISYWFFIYTQMYAYSENLSLILNTLLVYLLLFQKNSFVKFFISGILFGLSVLCRPDILLFTVFIIIWLWFLDIPRRKKILYYANFIITASFLIIPVMIRNYQISGDFLLRSQIGANFYAGNSPEYKGSNIYIEIGKSWQDFITTPYREMNIPLNPPLSETKKNHFFVSKTLRSIKEHPLQWLNFLTAKGFTILTGRDFLRSEDIYFYDLYIRSTPFRFVSTRLLFLLAIVGLLISFKEAKKFLLFYTFLFSAFFIIFFAYKTRYIVPVVPFIIIFSAMTINRCIEIILQKNMKELIPITLGILLLTGVSFLNPLKISIPSLSEMFYAIASNYHWYGLSSEAIAYYRKAIELNPQNISANNDLGMLYLKSGEYDKALIHFQQALDIDPSHYPSQYYLQLIKSMQEEGTSQPYVYIPTDEFLAIVQQYHDSFRYPREINGRMTKKILDYPFSKHKPINSKPKISRSLSNENQLQIIKEFYDDGNLYREWFYEDGKLKDGIHKEYYSSGELHFERDYKDGKANGITKEYNLNGQIIATWSYIDNHLIETRQ